MTGLLEIIEKDLRCERLDEMVLETKEYVEAMDCVQESYAKLQENLPKESKDLLEDYVEKLSTAAGIYDQHAYRQGMKDLMILFFDLIR